jgi:hypothetical protein
VKFRLLPKFDKAKTIGNLVTSPNNFCLTSNKNVVKDDTKCYHLFEFYCFCRSMDKENTGRISEKCFRKIMKGKDDVSAKEVEEMLEEYFR